MAPLARNIHISPFFDFGYDFLCGIALNLEVLDITTNASPDMFVNQTGISFTKRILDEMNYPANVQYAIDAGNKVFAIRSCKVNDAKAVPFSKPKSEQKTTLSSNNKNLVETIRALMKDKWKPDARYKVTGFYISETQTSQLINCVCILKIQ